MIAGREFTVPGTAQWHTGRTFLDALNIEVPAFRLGPIRAHEFMHSNIEVWQQYIEPHLITNNANDAKSTPVLSALVSSIIHTFAKRNMSLANKGCHLSD